DHFWIHDLQVLSAGDQGERAESQPPHRTAWICADHDQHRVVLAGDGWPAASRKPALHEGDLRDDTSFGRRASRRAGGAHGCCGVDWGGYSRLKVTGHRRHHLPASVSNIVLWTRPRPAAWAPVP